MKMKFLYSIAAIACALVVMIVQSLYLGVGFLLLAVIFLYKGLPGGKE